MTPPLLLAAILVSIAKPLLLFVTFVPWAWLVSSKLEKDARYFHLKRDTWNAVYLASAALALAAALLLPWFWLGWPLALLILMAPVIAYWKIRNDAVPEKERFYLTGEGLAAKLAARKAAKTTRGAMVRFRDAKGKERDVPVKEDPLYAVHILAEDLIGPALESRATHLEVVVGTNGGTVSQLVDGVRYKRDPLRSDAAMALVDYLKSIAGLSVEDRRRRQTANIRMEGPTGRVEISLATAGSSSGVELRLAFDVSKRVSRPFDGLGLLPAQLAALKEFEDRTKRHGVILLGAPPGHGLTTSSYSFTGRHDAYTSNIKVLERQTLHRMDGVDHVLYDPTKPDTDYATHLQSILRRDPDIVLAMDVADRATARVAIDPGMEGPLLYVPLRAQNTAGLLRDWMRLADDKRSVAALRAAICQRLLRTLCPNCRQPYTPSAEQLQKLHIPPGKVKSLYQAGGKVQVKNKIEQCPMCGGTGYLGQTGVFEVLIVDDEARRILLTGDLKAVLAHARRNKMIYLQEAALSKVVAGETTIEEVIRVTTPPKPASGPAARPRPNPTPAPSG